MTVWPSPIPGPSAFCPFDVPVWAVPALSRVVDPAGGLSWPAGGPSWPARNPSPAVGLSWPAGDRSPAGDLSWPAGDEAATWDLADQWFALAEALAGPREEAFAAAAEIASPGFDDAWRLLAGDPSAPLNALAPIAFELGASVAECARELEAAKLEAWIEIGRFLRDLLGLSLCTALTAPAVEVSIAATRLSLRQIFARLALRLATGSSEPGGSTEETTRRLFPPTTSADRELAAPAADEGETALSRESAVQIPNVRASSESGAESAGPPSSGISAAGILRRSYGSAESTRRITRSEMDRSARRDPREQTVAIPPNVPAPRTPGETTVLMEISGPIKSGPPPPATPASHFGYLPEDRRDEYSAYLGSVAEEIRAKISHLERLADREMLGGSPHRAEELRRHITDLRAILADVEAAATHHASTSPPPSSDPHSPSWPAAADPRGTSPAGALDVDTLRPTPGVITGDYGGLGAALGVHQLALENAMPRDGDGRATRLADPRAGEWFRLINAGGPAADPTRALNCTEVVLALYDTYLLGRPRVSAPRTFDAYAHGEPSRPTGGEWDGPQRIERETGTSFQNLCPFQGAADPGSARSAVDAALLNLTNHLHNSGHGAFAFVVTDLEGGGCHAWAAINHDGVILFLDPQLGRVSEETPLYAHRGVPADTNVISMDALVVDANAQPAPLPYHGPGQWSATAPPT